ncbi:MAG: hypothetical protein JRE16_07345 [Deltaproteobacteria bacterium]|jgi:predicted Zn-dependent protease|nr:hypothetical protein [Deltaproteobacteria bacterium]MBW2477882.1 hypothetical protein [Deltaproteobacteria bacterium]MBW2504371.1 hypothetical protein [Deltaproteobacteria bacterium]MBW2520157.1 hypothetical protein [Deltaproteobacteria bacterium]
MFSLLISLAVGLLFGFGLSLTTGLHPAVYVVVGSIVFMVLYFILMRKIMKKVSDGVEAAQRDLMANRPEKAVATIKSVQKQYGPWQFYIKKQMDAQIGIIHYMRRDFNKAYDYLKRGFVRHWIAMGMLGVIYMKRNKIADMTSTFDKAVAVTRKEPLLWNLYAYCLDHVGQREKAITVMNKALKKAGNDERLKANLEALQNNKKMKMQVYGDAWYQFHLEKTGAMIRKQTKAIQGRRKIVRR